MARETDHDYGVATRTIPVTEARRDLPALTRELSKENFTVAITTHGKPMAVMMGWEFYSTLMESLEIMSDQKLMEQLQTSLRQVAEGQHISIDEV